MPLECRFDHLVVTAADLESGLVYVRAQLGVSPSAGGEHPRMGTHNRLLKLGEGAFLEVIAPNPDAPPPDRPRWFGLDGLSAEEQPRLATWVVNTPSIHRAVAACPASVGEIEPMSRGDLNWLITIRPDGALPMGGLMPSIIEWATETHPAERLPESGCSLLGVELYHPEDRKLQSILDSVGFRGPVTVSPSEPEGERIVVHLRTPQGDRLLEASTSRTK